MTIGAHLNTLVERRMAATGGDYVTTLRQVVAEDGQAARAYAAGVETTHDLSTRLAKAIAAAKELLGKASPGLGAGSVSSLVGAIDYASQLVRELATIERFAKMPSYHIDAEITRLSRRIGNLEERLIGEARGVAADGAGVAAYTPPTQVYSEPRPLGAARVRNFGVILGGRRHD
jgi:hypothetical protein